MPFNPPFIQSKSFPGERTGPLRLVSMNGVIAVYRGATEALMGGAYQAVLTPTVMSGSGDPPPTVRIAQMFDMVAAYDIAPAGDGALAVAIEAFRGASNALQIGAESQGKWSLGLSYQDFHDYTCPRFVRGSAVRPGQFAAAIVGRSVFVGITEPPVEPARLTPQSAPFRALTDASDGRIGSAVAVADGMPPPPVNAQAAAPVLGAFPPAASLALFLLAQSTGGPPAPSGDLPGSLGLRAGGRRYALFDWPDNPAFAFDADVKEGVGLVLASTRTGPQLLGYNSISHVITPIPWPPDYLPPNIWIANPTVLAAPPETPGAKPFSFAFYEGMYGLHGPQVTGIRYGQVDLTTLP
jgi:hypothetical protein